MSNRFSWSVQPPTVALDWATKQSSSLVVRAGSLISGVTYTFSLTLLKPSGEFLSEASIDVAPRAVKPVAVIGGGDRRVRCNSTIALDALGSFDPMTGPMVLLSSRVISIYLSALCTVFANLSFSSSSRSSTTSGQSARVRVQCLPS